MVRSKQPHADLGRQYSKTLVCSGIITLLLHISVAVIFPSFNLGYSTSILTKLPVIIHLEDIPETHQAHRLNPPLRPSIPMEADVEEVPDDVIIQSAELNFDEITSIFSSLKIKTDALEPLNIEIEDIFDFKAVEKKPDCIQSVLPQYPLSALKTGYEGTVYIRFIVDKDGRVKNPQVISGPEIFRKPALTAVSQFLFTPASHEGKKVQVQILIPIEFRLDSNP